ncbi:MAG: hypothetical protein HY800_07490 [Ignavibacteriales bacterium]|nr:hypothetical protein [Ignavibacteriales bacterium]
MIDIVNSHRTYKVGVRRKTRQVNVGGVLIGSDAPISVQTMTKTRKVHLKKIFYKSTATQQRRRFLKVQ